MTGISTASLKNNAASREGAETVLFVQAICRLFEQFSRAFAREFSSFHDGVPISGGSREYIGTVWNITGQASVMFMPPFAMAPEAGRLEGRRERPPVRPLTGRSRVDPYQGIGWSLASG